MTLNRRQFLHSTAGLVTLPVIAGAPELADRQHSTPVDASARVGKVVPISSLPPQGRVDLTLSTDSLTSKTVSLAFDISPISHKERVEVLLRLLEQTPQTAGWYLQDGAVRALEKMAAGMYGKEDAVFLPTGTLANNIAVRILCQGEHRRTLVQADSHIYKAEGDAPQTLSGLTLVPLASGRASPSPEEVLAAVEASEHGYVPTRVGAISLENPVNGLHGSSIPFSVLERISAIARERKIGMHWDGARALMLDSVPGFDLKATAALFDTIYMSLYKYLDAPFGAVLMGTAEIIQRARELRHTYGGLIFTGWETTLPALQTLSTFRSNYQQAYARFTGFLAGLQDAGGFDVERVPDGTNVAFLRLSAERLEGLSERLAAANIYAAKPVNGRMPIYANLSILRRGTREVLAPFTQNPNGKR